jgi:hypothetical protein
MMVIESLIGNEDLLLKQEPVNEEVLDSRSSNNFLILEQLNDIVFKLRAFTESVDGDYALGIETGMQRAADMIENIINQHISKKENE